MDSSAARKRSLEKEVSHTILKIRVKTKVETSNLQTPVGYPKRVSSVVVTSPIQGSSRSSAIIPPISPGTLWAYPQ